MTTTLRGRLRFTVTADLAELGKRVYEFEISVRGVRARVHGKQEWSPLRSWKEIAFVVTHGVPNTAAAVSKLSA